MLREDWSWELLDPVMFGDHLSWSCEMRGLSLRCHSVFVAFGVRIAFQKRLAV